MWGGGAAGGGRSAGAFEAVRGGAVADEVDDARAGRAPAVEGRGRVDERDLARRGAQLCVAARVVRGEVGAARRVSAARALGLTNQEVTARLNDYARKIRRLPRRARGGRVLHRPPGEVDGRVAAVEQLDEVILEDRARVAAAAVKLADDDERRRGGSRRGRGRRRRSR